MPSLSMWLLGESGEQTAPKDLGEQGEGQGKGALGRHLFEE